MAKRRMYFDKIPKRKGRAGARVTKVEEDGSFGMIGGFVMDAETKKKRKGIRG